MSQTVHAVFQVAARVWCRRPFLHVNADTARHYGIASTTLNYQDVADRIAVLAACYRRAGYGPGHRIGLMLENRPAMFLHWFALNQLGASIVPLNPELRPPELAFVVQHSGICLAICAAPFADRISGCTSVTEGSELPDAPSPAGDEPAGLQTECALVYTSGTTGRPKGCLLSNDYFLRCGRWYTEIGGLCALHPGEDRLLTPLPMTHVNALAYSTLAMVMTGSCIIPLDRFHPRSWWRTVRESGATIMHSLGVMPTMLLGLDPLSDDTAHKVRFGFAPGVDPRHHAAFEQRFGIPMIDAWAMTETGAGAVVIASHEPRHIGQSCFGRPRPFMRYRIVDEAGDDVAAGTPGELLVCSSETEPRAGFFSGYLGDSEATEVASQSGWFHTGDVVRADADTNLYFVDRRKNVIRRSGENIAAAEVESVLRQHRMVADVACAAVPDELRGEEVMACIVPRETIARQAEAASDIVAYALRELAYFKVPGYVAFVPSLPLTATNKVQRAELKAWAERLLGAPGCTDTRALKRRT